MNAVMDAPTCYCCGSTDAEFVCDKVANELTRPLMREPRAMYSCARCGLVFTFPLPERSVVDDFYATTYNVARWHNPAALDEVTRWAGRFRTLKAISWANVALYPVPASLAFAFSGVERSPFLGLIPGRRGPGVRRALDIGCAEGSFVAKLMADGYLAEGIEPSEDMVAALRRCGVDNVHLARLEDFSTHRRYDLVHMRGVAMYMLDLRYNLLAATSLVGEGGTLMLVETNPDSRLDMSDFENPMYLNGLTLRFIRGLAVEAGFEKVKAFLYLESDLEFVDFDEHPEALNTKAKVAYVLTR